MTQLVYGDHKIDSTKLPSASIDALLRRGFRIVLGTEAASVANGAVPRDEATEPKGTDRTTTAAAYAKALATATSDKLAELVAGTIGSGHGGGPRGSKIDTYIRAIARKEVLAKLTANGLKEPKKANEKIIFPNGDMYNMAEMIARRLKVHGERIGKEAEKKMAVDVRETAKLAEGAKVAEGVVASAALLDN